MVGVVFRRALWCVVVGGWPAVAVLRVGLHGEWGTWLTVGGAPAEAACALLLRRLHAGARRRRASETERRLSELETRSAAADELGERVADLTAMLTLAFGYAGVGAPAHRRLHARASPDPDRLAVPLRVVAPP